MVLTPDEAKEKADKKRGRKKRLECEGELERMIDNAIVHRSCLRKSRPNFRDDFLYCNEHFLYYRDEGKGISLSLTRKLYLTLLDDFVAKYTRAGWDATFEEPPYMVESDAPFLYGYIGIKRRG